MRITYYALRPLLVGEDERQPGDLVPEAQDWRYLSGYIADGKVAPVLVATLPEEQQEMLLAWEEEVYGPQAVADVVEGPDDSESTPEDEPEEFEEDTEEEPAEGDPEDEEPEAQRVVRKPKKTEKVT